MRIKIDWQCQGSEEAKSVLFKIFHTVSVAAISIAPAIV